MRADRKSDSNLRARRGSAMVIIVIVSVVLTGLVLTIGLAAGNQSRVTGASIHTDRALVAAESAGQIAVWKFKQNNTWRLPAPTTKPTSYPTITIGNNTFTYDMTCTGAGATADLCWPFTENTGFTTVDISSHKVRGNLYGGVRWTSNGHFGPGLVFDGVSGYVDAGNGGSNAIDPVRNPTNIVGSVTMAAWVKLNTAAQDQKVGGNQDGVQGGYKMSIYNTKVEFEVRNATNNKETLNRSVSGGTILTMGTWYHVAGVYNSQNNTLKTYINGILDRSLTNTPANALGPTAGTFRMGREPWDVGAQTRYFNGLINDVRIYARALSAQELKTLADTSVHVKVITALQNASYAYAPASTTDFVCSSPTPLPPVAPALTVGGNLPMNKTTVNGDVQVTGTITAVATSSVNGKVVYGNTYSDPSKKITITGASSTPTKDSSVRPPTIDYAALQANALSPTYTGGTGQTFTFVYQDGEIQLMYIKGNVTDPIINTAQSGGTVYIDGKLTLTKNATFGAPGFPAYIVCKNGLTQTGGTMTLYGGLYVNGDWTHKDCTIVGDVSVTGNVVDNSVNGSTFTVGGIPWFDPRSANPSTPLPLYYTAFGAGNP